MGRIATSWCLVLAWAALPVGAWSAEGAVDVGLGRWVLLRDGGQKRPPKPPRRPVLFLSRDGVLTPAEGGHDLDVTWTITVPQGADAWRPVALDAAWPHASWTVDGDPAPGPAAAADWRGRLPPGRHTVRVRATVPAGAAIALPGAARNRLRVDGAGWAVEAVEAGAGVPVPWVDGAYRTPAATLRLVRAEERAPDADRAARLQAHVAVGVTLHDAEVEVRTRIDLTVLDGTLRDLVLDVAGLSPRATWTAVGAEGVRPQGGRWAVALDGPTDGAIRLEAVERRPLSGAAQQGIGALPAVRVPGAIQSRHVVVVTRDTDAEVVLDLRGGEDLAGDAIPAWARDVAAGYRLAARSHAAPIAGSAQVLRFEPVDRPPLVVDVADGFVTVGADGAVLQRWTLTVRNERAAVLDVTLPPGLAWSSVRVDGAPVRVARVGDRWRVPIPRSVETVQGPLSFPVDLVAVGRPGAPWPVGRSAQDVALPAFDAEVAQRRVRVQLPHGSTDEGDVGQGGRVAVFGEGDGLAYGFGAGVDAARAGALYQDALQAFLTNDFDAAQGQLDALRDLGGDNADVARLQANLDALLGEADDSAVAGRIRTQARARAQDAYRAQDEAERRAREAEAQGDEAAAAEAYAEVAELAEQLAVVEEKGRADQRLKKEAAKDKADALAAEVGGVEGGVVGGVLGGALAGAAADGVEETEPEPEAAPMPDAVGTGSLVGTVYDEDGLEVPGVQVQLLGSDGSVIGGTVSDASGRYRFDGVASGAVGLDLSHPAVVGVSVREVPVRTDATTRQDVTLSFGAIDEVMVLESRRRRRPSRRRDQALVETAPRRPVPPAAVAEPAVEDAEREKAREALARLNGLLLDAPEGDGRARDEMRARVDELRRRYPDLEAGQRGGAEGGESLTPRTELSFEGVDVTGDLVKPSGALLMDAARPVPEQDPLVLEQAEAIRGRRSQLMEPPPPPLPPEPEEWAEGPAQLQVQALEIRPDLDDASLLERLSDPEVQARYAEQLEGVLLPTAPPAGSGSPPAGVALDKDFLTRIPPGRSYQSAVQLSAGVTGGANPNLAGGAANENTFVIDGAEYTEPVTGTFGNNFDFDAVETTESTTVGSVLTKEFLQPVPGGRSYQQAVRLRLPGGGRTDLLTDGSMLDTVVLVPDDGPTILRRPASASATPRGLSSPVAATTLGRPASPDTPAPPVDPPAETRVTAATPDVLVPVVGPIVRFEHLLLAPGDDVPLRVRARLPRRSR